VQIEVGEPRSPGWWFQRLMNRLADREREARLDKLHNYLNGKPALPVASDSLREMFEAFQRKACSNFPALVVGAVSNRLAPVGFQTAVDDDVSGDVEAGRLWERAGMPIVAADVHELMLNLGEAFVIVGPVDDETDAPTVTAEDPRRMVAEADPARPQRLLAALKVLHDDVDGVDRAYLYLPGRVFVAVKANSVKLQWPPRFGADWVWEASKGGAEGQDLGHGRMPVVRFLNKRGLGEYETHLDVVDRINHGMLFRLCVAASQAFRQMAVTGLPDVDEEDQPIDYSKQFTLAPGAFWQLPPGAEMWESKVTDVRQLVELSKDDIAQLAAVTETPMYMMIPGGQNQSAEGASLAREGLVFRAEDRRDRVTGRWAETMSLMFEVTGDADRAQLARLRTLWKPINRLSLSEKADAASKAQNDIPRRSRLIELWGFPPDKADRMMTEWADEQVLAAQLVAVNAAGQPIPPPVPQVPEPVDPLAGMDLETIAGAEPVMTEL